MLAPLRRFKNDSLYRDWLRLSDKLSSIKPETETFVNVSGLHVCFSDASALLNMHENIFLNECYRFNSSHSKPVIIDCGANIGLSVLWFAKFYPGSTIIAFEPDPTLFGILKQNAGANKIQAALKNEAVWNQNTELKFTSSKKQNARISETGTTTVKAVRLKEVLETFPVVDLLKVDIEGAEHAVLSDCKNELYRVKNLFVECHFSDGKMGESLSILQWLQESGFNCIIQTPFKKSPFTGIQGFHTMDLFASKTSR